MTDLHTAYVSMRNRIERNLLARSRVQHSQMCVFRMHYIAPFGLHTSLFLQIYAKTLFTQIKSSRGMGSTPSKDALALRWGLGEIGGVSVD